MFRVEVLNKTYGVRFQYREVYFCPENHDGSSQFIETPEQHKLKVIQEEMNLGQPVSVRTVCEIFELNDADRTKELIVAGCSTCDTRDRFDKNIGRWLAFEMTMREAKTLFYKDQRKLFYEAYFRNHKHKRHILETA